MEVEVAKVTMYTRLHAGNRWLHKSIILEIRCHGHGKSQREAGFTPLPCVAYPHVSDGRVSSGLGTTAEAGKAGR